jgi:hypothetical protein
MSGTDEETTTTSDSSDTGSDSGDGGTTTAAAPTQEDFTSAFEAVDPSVDDSELSMIEPPSGEEAIAGETTDLVNAGVQVIKMIHNGTSVTITKDGYANALPAGVKAEDLAGWTLNKRVLSYGSGTSPWWEIWHADWSADIFITFMYGGNDQGVGLYVDQAHAALDNVVLPPDFSFEVEAEFPAAGVRLTPPSVGAIQLTLTWRLKGFLGQLLSAQRTKVMLLIGTGEIRDV